MLTRPEASSDVVQPTWRRSGFERLGFTRIKQFIFWVRVHICGKRCSGFFYSARPWLCLSLVPPFFPPLFVRHVRKPSHDHNLALRSVVLAHARGPSPPPFFPWAQNTTHTHTHTHTHTARQSHPRGENYLLSLSLFRLCAGASCRLSAPSPSTPLGPD